MEARHDARTLEAFEAALDLPESERDAWLAAEHRDDPARIEAVRRLLKKDAEGRVLLPTQPPDPVPLGEPLPPPERVGAYRITGPLGEGGMGVVYRAERDDGLFEHTAAVKLIRSARFDARTADRFAVERRALARLNHPNIARLLDGGVTPEGAPYILMDYVQGEPLPDRIVRLDLGPEAVVGLLLQVCDAVADAHRKLVVHGDLKPGNILVDGDGRVRLLDFGVARILDLAEADAAERGPLTVAYAGPERRAGEPPSTADDVYALGVLMRELASRRGPTLGDDAPERPLPRDLEAIAARATADEPPRRYGAVQSLADDLRRWLANEPVSARRPALRYLAARFVARRPGVTAAAAAAVLGLAATAAVTSVLYLQAEAARREADRRFAQARGMANYMLFDLSDELNHVPGSITVRRELVETSRRYLEELAAARGAPPEVKAEAALGYLRLAGLLGLWSSGQLGERQEAREMIAAAERLLAQAPPQAADDPAWIHVRGRLRFYQGFDAFNTGENARAKPLLNEAVALFARAAALRPGDREILADFWEARLNLADLIATDGDHAGSEAMLRRDLAEAPRRLAVLGDHDKAPLLLARTQASFGNARYYQDDPAAALAAYRRGAAIVEAEDARRPNRSRTASELMKAWWNVATTLDSVGRTAEALPLLDRAVAKGRERLAVDPDHEGLRRTLSLVELERAGVLARLGRGEAAVADARRELAERRARAAAKPGDSVLAAEALFALRPLAEVEKTVGDPRACADYRAARREWDAYRRRFGISRLYADTELKLIDDGVAACAKAGL